MTVTSPCLACELADGRRDLPGGTIFQSATWLVEHCVGPLGVGTLIVKPRRHCEKLSQLSAAESTAMGPLLATAATCVEELSAADQVYACLWSHAGWQPCHIHFVVQPSWRRYADEYSGPGPKLQAEMFAAKTQPQRGDVEAFADRAREWNGWPRE